MKIPYLFNQSDIKIKHPKKSGVNREHNIIVCRLQDLSVGWAQRIIDKHTKDTVVSGVTIISMVIGTTTRIRVFVEHSSSDFFPSRWFVKIPSLDWRAWWITALPRLLHNEVRFYREFTEAFPVNRPSILAAQSRLGLGSTLVLTDVTEFGAIPGRPGDALTASQAMVVVEQLACLHARFWNKVSPSVNTYWLANPIRQLEDVLGTVMAVPLMKRGLRLADGLIPLKLYAPAIHYARRRKKIMGFLSDGCQTLVHHDCHPGNLFWHQSQPGFLDWQLVRAGEGISDIAYFLATSLAPEVRRLHEFSLLSRYVQVLLDNGVEGIDVTSQMQRYRAHLVYPFEAMLITLSIGSMMDLESNLELIRRTAIAVEDHDTFSSPLFN